MKVLILLLTTFIMSTAYLQAQDPDEGCPQLTDKRAVKTFREAFDLFRDREFQQASQLFKEVVKIEPGVADSYFYLGYISFKLQQNVKAAETYLLKAVEICPETDIYAYYFLGDIYAGKEDWGKAAFYLKEFVKDPALIDNDGDLKRAQDLYKWCRFYNDMFSRPVPFDPRFIPGICTPNHEYLPTISHDGELAFYTRVIEMPPRKDDIFQKSYFKESLYFSTRQGNTFDGGQPMPYPFDQTENIGSLTLTLDNRELYVAIGKINSDNYMNVDICYSYQDADGIWSDLVPVPGINGPKTWETMPSVSSDGKTLYFVSDRPGGFGAGDIWVTRKSEDGKWSEPENLGPVINTAGEEKTPFIHTDSQTLYFSSGDALEGGGAGHAGLGGLDIFFSKKKEDGQWSKPLNIGYPINTESDESGFFVSTNGMTGYFTTNKLNGPGGYDVYSFDLYEAARPEQVFLIKGEVSQEDHKEPTKTRVEIMNVKTKKITEIPVDSVTGKYVAAIVFRNDYIMTVKKDDYAYESKYIAVEDSLIPPEPVKIDFEIKPIEVGKSYRLNDIYFATNSAELNDESRSVLDGFIVFLQENPNIKVSIEGHTDNVGKDEDNLKLSTDRARSVYEYIMEKGISGSRLLYRGFGEEKPVASNDTPDGRSKNRRTEFVIIEK